MNADIGFIFAYILLILTVAFFFAMIPLGFALSKGYAREMTQKIGWALFGTFLFPFALILILCLDRREKG